MSIKTLYVGNIPYSATEQDLLTHFGKYNAKNPRIIEGRGFAFVDIDSDQLDAAITETHDSDMGGRKLKVNEAKPRSERPAGGRGSYGEGYGGSRDDSSGGGGGYGSGYGGGGRGGKDGRGGGKRSW